MIQQAFRHYDDVGASIISGHYDLKNRDDQIILPEAWEDIVVPGIIVEIEVHRPPEMSSDESSEEEEDLAEQDAVEEIRDNQVPSGTRTVPARVRVSTPMTKTSKTPKEDPETEEEASEGERDSLSDSRPRRPLAPSTGSSASAGSSVSSGATAGSASDDNQTADTGSENSIESASTANQGDDQDAIAFRKLRVRIDVPETQYHPKPHKTQHAFVTAEIRRIWPQIVLLAQKMLTLVVSIVPGLRGCFVLMVLLLFGKFVL